VEINKSGMTVLIVEQNVLSTLEIASYAYVIEIGKNVIDGNPGFLIESDDVKNAYLGI